MSARERKTGVPNPLLSDRAWLEKKYIDQGTPVAEIAAEADADLSTVHLWLQRHEIPARGHDIDGAELLAFYESGETIAELGRRYDVERAIIYDRLYRMGALEVQLIVPAEQLAEWYERAGWSIGRIADELGISRRAVVRQLLAAGVEIRPAGRPRYDRSSH